jgi:hypothetical protein
MNDSYAFEPKKSGLHCFFYYNGVAFVSGESGNVTTDPSIDVGEYAK